jgi:hypothetical protein
MEQQQPPQSEILAAPAGATSCAAVSQEEWIESVVGRDWEIFWKPEPQDEEEEEKPHPEQDAPQPTLNETPVGIDSEMAPSGPDQDVVMIDGSDQVATGTQPNEETEQGVNTEVSVPDDEDDDDEHEEDWYAAHIVAVAVPKEQQPEQGGLDSTGSSTLISPTIFQVRFVGEDDTTYDMLLTPDIVRPCARAWIRRTRALLLLQLPDNDGPNSNGSASSTDAHQRATSLPHDTSTGSRTASDDTAGCRSPRLSSHSRQQQHRGRRGYRTCTTIITTACFGSPDTFQARTRKCPAAGRLDSIASVFALSVGARGGGR